MCHISRFIKQKFNESTAFIYRTGSWPCSTGNPSAANDDKPFHSSAASVHCGDIRTEI
jgi:hypothetical protein